MKALLHRFILVGLLLFAFAAKGYGAGKTYDWLGATLTGSTANWNTIANWQVAGVAATALPGASDIVRIAVNPFVYNPAITDAESCASIIFGTYDNFTLTVTGTLTVSGNITQNNDPNFYQYTVLAGSGTVTCGSFNLGDNTLPSTATGVVNNVSCKLSQLTINGNVTLNSVGNSTNDGIEYPYFSLDSGKLTVTGQIVTTTFTNPLSGGVGVPTYPGLGLFQMDTGTSPTTLELSNISPVATPITTGFTVDFTNNGAGAGTVLYDAAAGTQTVYTTGTTGLGINNYNYDYLTFGGASKKTVIGGMLTVGNNWTSGGTGAVDLSTNNPTVTITGNWVNSANVTQGSGNITTNGLQNSTSTITLGSGTLTVSGAFQNNSGTFACGSGSVIFDGNYTNSSTFTAGTGTVYFSGVSQTLTDNGATGTNFNNVTFNCTGTATMAAGTGNFSVSNTGVLTMVSPANLVAGSATTPYLTLKSGATGSATVPALSGTSTITGFVNVQRYLTGGTAAYRDYRLLTSPVYVATVGSVNVYNFDYIHAGMLLTGAAGGGFDKTGNPSLYLYRENQAFSNVSFMLGNFSEVDKINNVPTYNVYTDGLLTNYNASAGNGFLVFFRGDRTTNLANKYKPGTVAESVTLTATGSLNQGQITVRDWYTPASANLGYTVTAGNAAVRGFNLAGNPYASSINWDLFNTTTSTSGIYGTSIGTTIYVLDPVSKNYGAYVKGNGGVGTHNASNVIASGQGFFVVASTATAQLIFNESAKVNTQVTGSSLLMGMPVDYTGNQYLHLELGKDSINTDDAIIRFKYNVGATYDPVVDAPYKQGFGAVSLSTMSSDKVPLAINVQPFPQTKESIPLSASATADGTYQIQVKNIVKIPQIFDISLVDSYTKDSVDLRESPIYSFSITKSDSGSFGANRFKLIISQNAALAYRLINFSATPSSSEHAVQLTWKTINEQNYTLFTVERSTDNGKTFEVAGGLQSSGQGTYALWDKNPQNGLNLYRLKQDDINDNISYSKVIPVEYSGLSNNIAKTNISLYPNPASNMIHLTVRDMAADGASNYNIRITNSSGMMVKNINSAQPEWQGNVGDLLTGTYVIQVVNTRDQSLVGKTKFVKL